MDTREPDHKTKDNIRVYLTLKDKSFLDVLEDLTIYDAYEPKPEGRTKYILEKWPLKPEELKEIIKWKFDFQSKAGYEPYPDSPYMIEIPEKAQGSFWVNIRISKFASQEDIADAFRHIKQKWLSLNKKTQRKRLPDYLDFLYAVSRSVRDGKKFNDIERLVSEKKLVGYEGKLPASNDLLTAEGIRKYYSEHKNWVEV